MEYNFLNLLTAESHLDLSHREQRVVNLFHQLHDFHVRRGKRTKLHMGAVCRSLHITRANLAEVLTALVLRKVVVRVSAHLVEVSMAGVVKHSILKLEELVECPVHGVILDESSGTFFCFNYVWEKWTTSDKVTIVSLIRRFSPSWIYQQVPEDEVRSALQHFCWKFAERHGKMYRVTIGSRKTMQSIIERLMQAGLGINHVYGLIDFAFARRMRIKALVIIPYIAEDVPQYLEQVAPKASSGDLASIEVDVNGTARVQRGGVQ